MECGKRVSRRQISVIFRTSATSQLSNDPSHLTQPREILSRPPHAQFLQPCYFRHVRTPTILVWVRILEIEELQGTRRFALVIITDAF